MGVLVGHSHQRASWSMRSDHHSIRRRRDCFLDIFSQGVFFRKQQLRDPLPLLLLLLLHSNFNRAMHVSNAQTNTGGGSKITVERDAAPVSQGPVVAFHSPGIFGSNRIIFSFPHIKLVDKNPWRCPSLAAVCPTPSPPPFCVRDTDLPISSKKMPWPEPVGGYKLCSFSVEALKLETEVVELTF